MATCPLAAEYAWTDKSQYNDAERIYYESLSGATKNVSPHAFKIHFLVLGSFVFVSALKK